MSMIELRGLCQLCLRAPFMPAFDFVHSSYNAPAHTPLAGERKV